jgi:hypothetical protein
VVARGAGRRAPGGAATRHGGAARPVGARALGARVGAVRPAAAPAAAGNPGRLAPSTARAGTATPPGPGPAARGAGAAPAERDPTVARRGTGRGAAPGGAGRSSRIDRAGPVPREIRVQVRPGGPPPPEAVGAGGVPGTRRGPAAQPEPRGALTTGAAEAAPTSSRAPDAGAAWPGEGPIVRSRAVLPTPGGPPTARRGVRTKVRTPAGSPRSGSTRASCGTRPPAQSGAAGRPSAGAVRPPPARVPRPPTQGGVPAGAGRTGARARPTVRRPKVTTCATRWGRTGSPASRHG